MVTFVSKHSVHNSGVVAFMRKYSRCTFVEFCQYDALPNRSIYIGMQVHHSSPRQQSHCWNTQGRISRLSWVFFTARL